MSTIRAQLGNWVESQPVQRVIVTLIIVNALTLGLETSEGVMKAAGTLIHWLDVAILAVFVAELGLKLIAEGPRFFRDPWNIFDFLVVGIALVPSSGPLAVLRALRVLRVLRLVSMMPRLRFVVEALLKSFPGILSIGALMVILLYVFAVMATGLFGNSFPEWFGSIQASAYTLFQIMTLESWSMGIARPVMEIYPYAWAFFVPFILIGTFTMLNLFIAVIVSTMQSIQNGTEPGGQAPSEQGGHSGDPMTNEELKSLREEIRALRHELAAQGRGDGGYQREVQQARGR